MSKLILGLLAGLLLGGAATWTLLKHNAAGHPEEKAKEEAHEEPRLIHTNDQKFIKLDHETQEHAGIKTAPLQMAELKPELPGFGRVLDPAPLAALLSEDAAVRAALDASTREWQRLKVLHAQDQNVSARAVETAEAAVKRDQILVESVQAKLLTGWGKAVAEQKDLAGFVRALAAQDTALVRVDLPAGEPVTPTGLRLLPTTAGATPVDAQLLGPALTVDPQWQGQGFLALVKPNTAHLVPGTVLTALLQLPGDPVKGVVVPRAAVIRHDGLAWAYVQTSDERFTRREVALEHPAAAGWVVTNGLAAGDKIVIVGGQVLLSEELKAASPTE